MNDLKERYLKIRTLKETEEKRVNDLDLEIALLESDLDVKQQAQGVLDLLVEKEVEEGVKTYISYSIKDSKLFSPNKI